MLGNGSERDEQRTRWATVDVQGTLLQLSGVSRSDNPVTFAGQKTRAVVVPRATCETLGISVFDRDDMLG